MLFIDGFGRSARAFVVIRKVECIGKYILKIIIILVI